MFADLHTFIFEHSVTSGRHSQTTVAASLIHTHIDYANSLNTASPT